MARPKKPLEQHIVDGTYRPSVHGPLPEKLEAWRQGDGDAPGFPEKPADLSPDESVIWDHAIATSAGRFWPSHANALGRYCFFEAVFRAKRKAILEAGGLDKATQPQMIEIGIADTKLSSLEKEFGMTPKAQAALPVVQTGPKKAQVETRPDDIDAHLEPRKAKKKSRKKAA